METQAQQSPVQEQPAQELCLQASPVQEQAAQAPRVDESTADDHQPQADKPAAKTRATRLHRKEILLGEITQLVLQGQTGRAIAMKLKLPVRTVNHWLGQIRSQWRTAATQSGADLAALAPASTAFIARPWRPGAKRRSSRRRKPNAKPRTETRRRMAAASRRVSKSGETPLLRPPKPRDADSLATHSWAARLPRYGNRSDSWRTPHARPPQECPPARRPGRGQIDPGAKA
jgi:hypothetical protein